ncbi:MAG: hypothetical protein AAF320_01270 [Myxococcota bacterium]
MVNQTKTGWLTGRLLMCIFAAHPSAALQGTQEGSFVDADGNTRKGFGAKDCEDTAKTLKIKVEKNSDKIEHYSIKKKDTSSSKKLTCSPSDTKPVDSIENFRLLEEICKSASAKGSEGLLCLYADDKKTLIAQIPFEYDTVEPNAPSIEVVEGEQEVKLVLKVDNKNPNSLNTAKVCYIATQDSLFKQLEQENDCPVKPQDLSITDSSVTVTGLENGVEYGFKVQVTDKSNNQSGWSKTVKGTPSELQTALGEADWKRNPLGMNCSSFGLGGPIWLLWALYRMGMQRRRDKRKPTQTKNASTCKPWPHVFLGISSGIGFLTVVFLTSFPIQAAPGQVSFGVNGSPYKPDMDRKLTTPVYGKFFGKSSGGPWLPLMGIEANVHLFDGYGSIQLGPALNYTWASGYARKENGEQSQVKLQLHLYQIRPQLTYVFDPYVHVVPLAPYVRAGFVAMGYVFTFDGRLDRHGQHPAGFVLGWDAAFGLLFLLDGLQPGVSTRAQATGVYRHVYLKTELSYAQIDNFGMGGPLLSPKGMFGASIPLMATFGLLIQL